NVGIGILSATNAIIVATLLEFVRCRINMVLDRGARLSHRSKWSRGAGTRETKLKRVKIRKTQIKMQAMRDLW
ncbi:MAG: hypothetical protein ABW185_13910, partial [Sedimenticola sp.]